MNQKNKAFTLIELLAVIIILVAITLIIAPLVLDIIKEQKMKTFKESINGVLRSSRLELVNSGLSFPATFTYSDGKLVSPSGKELKVTGKIPNGSGTVTYKSEDDIELAIHDSDWCGTYNKISKEVDVSEYDGVCALVASEHCFEVEDYEYTDYTINETECIAYYSSLSNWTTSEATSFCTGGKGKTLSLEASILANIFTISVLKANGVVTVNGTVQDGVRITKYHYDDSDCPTELVIPSEIMGKKVTAIGDNSFISNGLTSLVIPEGVKDIGDSAFSKNQLTTVILPEGLLNIKNQAFSHNKLTSIVIPDSVISIGNHDSYTPSNHGVFMNNSLNEIVIGKNVQYIGPDAFRNNEIKSVQFPSSVSLLEYRAFSDNQLEHVSIPDGIVTISFELFSSNNLISVEIPDSVTTIGDSAFYNNRLTTLEIPDSVTSISKSAFNHNQLPDDQAFIYARNSDGSIDYTKLISYGGAKRDNVVIPSNVTSIGDDAFFGNQLTSVTIPDSVTSIGIQAFSHNELTSVTIQGKSSSSDFTYYPSSTPFGWASGYSDSNIIWNG